MAKVKPFKGIRPPKKFVEEVESRPYDVLDSEEARAEAGDNEKSLYHIIKPEINFSECISEYDPKVYESAAVQFRKFQEKGWLKQDAEENYYLYSQTMNGKTQYGLVVCAHVSDYLNGVIKKHELTRKDKEEDRMKHVRVNNANLEPVFFAYLKDDFMVEDKGTEIYKPAQIHEFSLYLESHWYSLKAKPGTYDDNDPIGVLDVDISSRLILDKLLGIKDLRTDKRIDFVGGLRGLSELKRRVDSGEMKMALALYPVTMKQIMDIADSGNIMPPKATWFEPKLRSGLIIHSLD